MSIPGWFRRLTLQKYCEILKCARIVSSQMVPFYLEPFFTYSHGFVRHNYNLFFFLSELLARTLVPVRMVSFARNQCLFAHSPTSCLRSSLLLRCQWPMQLHRWAASVLFLLLSWFSMFLRFPPLSLQRQSRGGFEFDAAKVRRDSEVCKNCLLADGSVLLGTVFNPP